MKPSIKPPPPINRQRRPQKKYKSQALDLRDVLAQPWFKTVSLAVLGLVCVSLLIKFWPARDVDVPSKEIIAKVEAPVSATTRVEPVKLPIEGQDSYAEAVAKANEKSNAEKKRERVLGYSSERLTGQFVSVVASMENIDSAIEMHQDLRKSEINSEIITDYSRDEMWYRVVASRSADKSKVMRASRRYDFDTWVTSLSSRAKLIISYD